MLDSFGAVCLSLRTGRGISMIPGSADIAYRSMIHGMLASQAGCARRSWQQWSDSIQDRSRGVQLTLATFQFTPYNDAKN